MSEQVVLRPAGELDLATVEPLRVGWFALAADVAPPVVVVDLAAVTFADASFVNLLVGVRRRQAEHGGTLRVRHATPPICRLLCLTGLADLLEPGLPVAPQPCHRVVDLRVLRPPRQGTVGHLGAQHRD